MEGGQLAPLRSLHIRHFPRYGVYSLRCLGYKVQYSMVKDFLHPRIVSFSKLRLSNPGCMLKAAGLMLPKPHVREEHPLVIVLEPPGFEGQWN